MAGEEKPEQIVDTFENTGEKFDVDFFVVDRKFASTFDTTVTVYGTDKVKEELREKGVLRDKAKSIFFGTTEVQFVPFSQIGDITKYENFYFLGDESDMAQMRGFKAELIDRYGGGFPKQFGNDQELWLNLLLVWSIIAGLVLGVTGCSCLYQKKENMVKVILGEKPGQLFIRNSLEDTVLLTTLFLIIPYLLAPLTNTYFKYSFSMIVLWGILLINLLLHTTVLRMRYKRDLSGSYSEKGLLLGAYALKMVTLIMLCVLLSSNIVMIREGYNLYQQKDFFAQHKDYNYYRIGYKIDGYHDTGDDDRLNQIFYEEFQDNALQYIDLSDNYSSPYPVLLYNRAAMKEIGEQYPLIDKMFSHLEEEQIYLFIPADLINDKEIYDTAHLIGDTFFSERVFGKIEIVPYDISLSATGVHCDRDYQMKLYDNPIILFNNDEFHMRKDFAGYDGYYQYDIMYDINDTQWRNFVAEHQLERHIAVESNVQEVYLNQLDMAKRNIFMGIILSCFIFCMEIGLIFFIIRTEYQFHAIERALQKVHGYTLIRRNSLLLWITTVSSSIGTVVGLVASSILGMPGGVLLVCIGLILMAIEICCVLKRAVWMEKLKVSTILKGERL